MISSEVQRTLVKSPPELWAELSDPAALARHLGELGEIRIVRTEPERVVEWAAENTTGTVSIKPSGWGTKVTLTVNRETAESTPAPAQAPAPAPEASAALESPPADAADEPETPVLAPEPEVMPEPAPAPELEVASLEVASDPGLAGEPPECEAESEPVAEVEPAPRRGFFARLFGRRRKSEPAPPLAVEEAAVAEPPDVPDEPPETPAPTLAAGPVALSGEPAPEQADAFAAVSQALAPETFATAHPFDALPELKAAAGTAPAADIAAELMAAEDVHADEVTAEEVTAVLTAVLDRLGAAHHRPFSRA
jgi:hypothetical protein